MFLNNFGYPQYPQNYPQANNFQNHNLPKCEVIKVNGENGAKAFKMAPDSQCLLLDNTAPIVWLCQSDGAGYHNVVPFKITPFEPEPQININELNDRISRLEALLNEPTKSDVKTSKPKSKSNNE